MNVSIFVGGEEKKEKEKDDNKGDTSQKEKDTKRKHYIICR
jgi:hypothetical protein